MANRGVTPCLLSRIASAPWFAHGTPEMVEAKVREIVDRAMAVGQVPVLVAYNIPFRDCALYSADGASDGAAYLAWVKGFAAGIGERKAIVILEPEPAGFRGLAARLPGPRSARRRWWSRRRANEQLMRVVVPGRRSRIGFTVESGNEPVRGIPSHFPYGLMYRGQLRPSGARHFRIVETGDRHLLRDGEAEITRRRYGCDGHVVVLGEDCRGTYRAV